MGRELQMRAVFEGFSAEQGQRIRAAMRGPAKTAACPRVESKPHMRSRAWSAWKHDADRVSRATGIPGRDAPDSDRPMTEIDLAVDDDGDPVTVTVTIWVADLLLSLAVARS